jgi:hypothetical protein
MAEINLVTNTYAGIKYAQYLTPALLPTKGIVDKGIVTGIDSVKNKVSMLGVSRNIELQNPSANFNAQAGNIDRTEKQLELVAYEVMDEIDAENLRLTWESEQMGRGSFEDYKLTPQLYDFLLEKIYVPRMAIANEQLYILGKAGVSGTAAATFTADYPGVLARIEAASDTNKFPLPASALKTITAIASGAAGSATITLNNTTNLQPGDRLTLTGTNGNQQIGGVTIEGQTVTVRSVTSGTVVVIMEAVTGATPASTGTASFINVSNVLEVMNFMYRVTPQRVKRQRGFDGQKTKMLVSYQVADAYRIANAAVAGSSGEFYRVPYFDNEGPIPFLDVEVQAMPYWPDNAIAVWNPSNVFLGYDLLSDEVMAQVVYLEPYTLDQVYRVKNRMKSDINFKYGNEISFIRPA